MWNRVKCFFKYQGKLHIYIYYQDRKAKIVLWRILQLKLQNLDGNQTAYQIKKKKGG